MTLATQRSTYFSRPGKRDNNAYLEVLSGSLHDDCLKLQWFENLDDAGGSGVQSTVPERR